MAAIQADTRVADREDYVERLLLEVDRIPSLRVLLELEVVSRQAEVACASRQCGWSKKGKKDHVPRTLFPKPFSLPIISSISAFCAASSRGFTRLWARSISP